MQMSTDKICANLWVLSSVIIGGFFMQIEDLIRPEVKNFQPYIPGKPINEVARELKLKRIIKLASNENPLGPSPAAIKTIRKKAAKVYFYPESSGIELRNKLAKKFRINPDWIILGNGSDEIIELLGKAFLNNSDEIIVSKHAFIRYAMAGWLMGCSVKSIPMQEYRHNLEAMSAAITPRTKIIFIANPNNPTGTYVEEKGLKLFLKKVAENILVVIDEAYYEYACPEPDYPDTTEYLSDYKNLIVLRTFSKIYALAGLRIGYGIATPKIIEYLDRIRPPFNVNTLAQVAAIASLDDKKQITAAQLMVKNGKQYLYPELSGMGLEYIPSAANFVLINIGRPSKEVFEALLKEGIIVRPMEEYDFPDSIRVTIGRESEMKFFVKALKKIRSKK